MDFPHFKYEMNVRIHSIMLVLTQTKLRSSFVTVRVRSQARLRSRAILRSRVIAGSRYAMFFNFHFISQMVKFTLGIVRAQRAIS